MILLLLSVLPLSIAFINILSWKRPVGIPTSSTKTVSVLIPARNEEDNIKTCVEHIYESAHQPHEVIVYNDHSTDSTLETLQQLQEQYSTLHIIQGGPLPSGWAGKNHACHHLANGSTGDILLFIDADTRIEPHGIGHLVSLVDDPKLPSDMVTALPRQSMDSFAEKVLMPFLPLTFIAWLPLELVRRLPFPSMTAAIGQVVTIRRQAYLQSGGFEAIPAELVDDMALATRFKKLGLTVRFVDGFHIASCRMYDSFATIWDGFSKNVFLGLRQLVPLWLLVICLYTICFILPFAMLPVAFVQSALLIPIMVGIGCNVLIRFFMTIRFGHSWTSVLFHPIASIVVVCIFINSGIQTMMGKVEWKGREYGDAKL